MPPLDPSHLERARTDRVSGLSEADSGAFALDSGSGGCHSVSWLCYQVYAMFALHIHAHKHTHIDVNELTK